jgi:hypothetical protein
VLFYHAKDNHFLHCQKENLGFFDGWIVLLGAEIALITPKNTLRNNNRNCTDFE